MKPRRQFELRIHGRKVLLGERTLVMGVVNVTPDSFSDGGLYFEPTRAIEHGLRLARDLVRRPSRVDRAVLRGGRATLAGGRVRARAAPGSGPILRRDKTRARKWS